jgi:hypothetical protein
VRQALSTDAPVAAQVDKYYQEADEGLMQRYNTTLAELASLLSPPPLRPAIQLALIVAFAIALFLLIGGIFYIVKTKLADTPLAAFSGLVRGSMRSIIALIAISLIFLLILLDYLVKQQTQTYLHAALASVIVLYFVTRALDTFYVHQTGFTFLKTFPDGTKEKLRRYQHPETGSEKDILTHLQSTVDELGELVREIHSREEEGLGFVSGIVSFSDNRQDKSGVDVSLVGLTQADKLTQTYTTRKDGLYIFRNVPPGNYTLELTKPDFTPHPNHQAIELRPMDNVKVPTITMRLTTAPVC